MFAGVVPVSVDLSVSQVEETFPELTPIEPLDEGGQKKVFTAHLDGEKIVLKAIPDGGKRAARRADREIEAMEILESDFIVNLVDYSHEEIEGNSFVVLIEEFLPGRTLKKEIEEEGESLSLGLRTLEAGLDVIGELEREGLVHRDIKPKNIIVGPDGGVTLLDIGLVRFLDKESITPTFADRGPGTYNYMSSEQLNNRKRLQDHRTDFFSLGVVFFEASTGVHPFDLDLEVAIPDAVLAGRRRDFPDELVSGTGLSTNQIEDFMDRMVAPQPHERYRTTQQARRKLAEIQEGFNV